VRARNTVREAWAQIDVQLRVRTDLVPALVEAVKGYAAHERSALDAVARARAGAQSVAAPGAAGEANEALEGALRGLYAVAEAYPDLQADTAYRDLQSRLTELENDIASARRYYNAIVQRYHDLRGTFPVMLITPLFGFRAAEYFQAAGAARLATEVDLGG
jgi:LemA protein